jgi:type 1 glutamine amidotransferase
MKKLSIHIFILLAVASMAGCNKPINMLLVVGGHGYDTTEFYDMFRSLKGIRFDSVSYPGAREFLQTDQINEYEVLVFYDFIPDMPEKDSSIFLSLTQQGKSMLFLHHSLCTFQGWDGYMHMVGGRYVMEGYASDSSLLSDYKHDIDLEVKVVNNNHPLTRGVSDFEIHDEGYSNIMILDEVIPLLSADHPDCSPLVGWTHTFNRSATAYLIFGHDKYAYENSSFQQLLSNAIHWLAGQDE